MRQRHPNQGAFSDEATRVLTLIDALQDAACGAPTRPARRRSSRWRRCGRRVRRPYASSPSAIIPVAAVRTPHAASLRVQPAGDHPGGGGADAACGAPTRPARRRSSRWRRCGRRMRRPYASSPPAIFPVAAVRTPHAAPLRVQPAGDLPGGGGADAACGAPTRPARRRSSRWRGCGRGMASPLHERHGCREGCAEYEQRGPPEYARHVRWWGSCCRPAGRCAIRHRPRARRGSRSRFPCRSPC